MSLVYIKSIYKSDPKTCDAINLDSITLFCMNMSSNHVKATGRLMTEKEVNELVEFFRHRLMLENRIETPNELI
jgi:hypothetical protein